MSAQRLLLAVMLSAVFFASGVNAAEQEFDGVKMMSELESELDLSGEKKSQLESTIHSKSDELKKSIHGAVDKGFVELEALSRRLGGVSKEAEKKVREILNSEEMLKLKAYLNKIDEEAIVEVKNRLIQDISKFLDLTDDQVQKLKPVLEESFSQLGEMITELGEHGSKSWDEFKLQYEQFSKELREKLQDSLDSEQMKKLDRYNEEKMEKIHMAMFSA